MIQLELFPEVELARLDTDGKALPKTKLVVDRNEREMVARDCQMTVSFNCGYEAKQDKEVVEYQDEDGNRIPLNKPDDQK